MIVNFYKLNIRELLEVERERARDVVERAVGLAIACEIDVRDSIGKLEFAVTRETVEDERQPLVAFHVAGTIEKLVQDSANQVL